MNRIAYQALGFAVWRGSKWYLRRRCGDAPRRLALGALLAMIIAAAVLGGRRFTES